jgi:hypothetical protein
LDDCDESLFVLLVVMKMDKNSWYFWTWLLSALVACFVAVPAYGQRAQNALSDEQYIEELNKGLDSLQAELQGKPQHPLIFSPSCKGSNPA